MNPAPTTAQNSDHAIARVLIVDDEQGMRELLRRLLERNGFQVSVVSRGELALAELLAQGADTVLVDIHLPGMSGLEVCTAIRSHSRLAHVPVIFVTGQDDVGTRTAGTEAGADDFLVKPVDERQLLARVRSTVRVKRGFDQLERENDSLRRVLAARTRDLDAVRSRLDRVECELRMTQEQIIDRLVRAAEFRDDQTGSHLQRISSYCRLLAERLGLEPSVVEAVRVASEMHDVGKLGIPDQVLLKPGRLTPAEFEVMKRHTSIGHDILADSGSPLLDLAADIAHSHHERWDGTGYPRRLRGEEIPLAGRIVAVADVYDALTHSRVYKLPWRTTDAVEYVRRQGGQQFDPMVVDAFLGSIREVHSICDGVHP